MRRRAGPTRCENGADARISLSGVLELSDVQVCQEPCCHLTALAAGGRRANVLFVRHGAADEADRQPDRQIMSRPQLKRAC